MKSIPPSSGRWIPALRLFWYLFALLAINALISGSWNGYTRLVTVCEEEVCSVDRLTPAGVAALEALGLSASFYAAYNTALVVAIALIYLGVAALIFWARPRDRGALLVSLTLLLVGVFMTDFMEALRELHPVGRLLVDLMSVTGYVLFLVVCCTFPDGRFVPRWTRWPVGLWAVIIVPYYVLVNPEWDMDAPGALFLALIFVFLLVACAGLQIYRYRCASSPIQRLQSRWVTIGLLQLVLVICVAGFGGTIWFPAMETPGTLAHLLTNFCEALSLMLVPVTIAASILRYRLWNINLLLNRTLVYVPLTTLLAGLYSVVMTVSQKLFVGVTGQKSDAAVVLTGFILTVTYTPLKSSLQSLVDKQFKEKPDLMKQLLAFDAQVQQVADIIDPLTISRRLAESAILAYGARGGAIYLCRHGVLQLIFATPEWQDENSGIQLPLKEQDGEPIGFLHLGHQEDGTVYSSRERRALRCAIARVAQVLRLTDSAIGTTGPVNGLTYLPDAYNAESSAMEQIRVPAIAPNEST
ncbi:MAG: hypothetical protein KF753_10675 [Caldilineaceae bacterium]|nr:hypothetical protein [Caldilineaceae bacterium]